MHKIAKATTVVLAVLFALAVTACGGPTQSEFAGKWKVADTAGTPFEITLGDDGSATANRSGEAMEGTWKEEKGAVIISWKDGWTTKIAKDGDGYTKTAWNKGLRMNNPSTNTSSAEKVN
ncbi:MAG: hypothetical protein KAI80_08570 [Hyphomicrobiaceae bacterium]|nr:hypothetical protein [Hyphomicrobiaceae bacterium]